MSTASLSLLKKGKKDALADELAKGEKPAASEAQAAEASATVAEGEDTVTVDVEKMTETELDEFVATQGIETPGEWVSLDHAAKIAWMQTTFGAPEESTGAEVKAAAAAPAEEAKAAEPEKPPKAKSKKAKSKEVAVSNAKEGEIVGPDILQDLVHEIETMKEKEALEAIGQLTEQTELTFFKLGGVLSVVQANQWYAPYATFKEFLENVHGLHYRKATYWIEIYNRLSDSGVPWTKVSKLGWTKLKEIAKVLTQENVDEWVKIASEQNTITLIETVKNALAKDAPKALEDQMSKTVTTMTFKVHEDQKTTIEGALAKAKEVTGTQVSTAALEFICIDYLGTLSDLTRVKAWGLDKVLKLVEEAFPEANLTLEMGEASETDAAA